MNDMRMPTWRPTTHLDKLRSIGRNRPPPSIGSPTFVWHIGIWRKGHEKGLVTPEGDVPQSTDYLEAYDKSNQSFHSDIFKFLQFLQERGCLSDAPIENLQLDQIILEGALNKADSKEPRRFEHFEKQSVSFTLWWRDDASAASPNTRLNSDAIELQNALRVFVQFQSYQDHATITFYIDGAKKFHGKQLHSKSDQALTSRQARFFEHLTTIRRTAHMEIKSGVVDLPSSESRAMSDTKALQAASDYLYQDFWSEFQDSFGFNLADSGNELFKSGAVFINQRGLLLSIRGLDTPADELREQQISELRQRNKLEMPFSRGEDNAPEDEAWLPSSRGAYATLGPVDVFDKTSGEPEVVLKSVWPFLRCVVPGAESCDWVGCGILEWRALLVSTFGSKPQRFDDASSLSTGPYRGTVRHDPDRFLILSKGEPHRKQIGRMVERLVALETLRAFSFKNIGVIQNSYLYLRVLTSQLDDILKSWSTERQKLEQEKGRGVKTRAGALPARGRGNDEVEVARLEAREAFYNELSALNERVETRLITIGADLERMGPGGSGHLSYSIDRAQYCIREFRRLAPSLEVGNIAGWTNYEQFVDRGLQPTFNMIETTGYRLAAAQERLKTLTDVVQVSALIVQSDATRRNTDTLREIGLILERANVAAIDRGNLYNERVKRIADLVGWKLAIRLAVALGAVIGFVGFVLQMLVRYGGWICKAVGVC